MKVFYYGLIRNVLKNEEEEISLAGEETMADLLESLCQRHGPSFRDSLFALDGKLRSTVRILLGKEEISQTEALHRPLQDSKEVSILIMVPPVAGG